MFDCLGRLEEKGRLMGPTMLSDAPTPGLMIHNRPIPTPMQPSEFRAIIKSGKVSCHTANLYEAARMERVRIQSCRLLPGVLNRPAIDTHRQPSLEPGTRQRNQIVLLTNEDVQEGNKIHLHTGEPRHYETRTTPYRSEPVRPAHSSCPMSNSNNWSI